MELWEDFYSVLQVHPDAEAEVIQSAYKRLCRKYHPDVNTDPSAGDVMQRINRAWQTLGQEETRRAYHTQWLRRNKAPVRESAVGHETGQGTPEARKTAHDYFEYISSGRFEQAFGLVSDADKAHFGFESFRQWQESVSSVYEIGRFSIALFKIFDNLKIDARQKYRGEEYTVSLSEKNKSTGAVIQYSFNKIVVWEQGRWRIYLGYRDLTPLMMQFKFIATTQPETQLLGHWDHYKQTTDLGVGLPNVKGFSEQIETEAYRNRRYGRPFSVAVFQFVLPERINDPAQMSHIFKYVGYLLVRCVRAVDSVGYLGGGQFATVFSETNKKSVLLAVRRIVRSLRHDVASCFDFETDIVTSHSEYEGQTAGQIVEECVRKLPAVQRT